MNISYNKCINLTAGCWRDFQDQSGFGSYNLRLKFCTFIPAASYAKSNPAVKYQVMRN